MVLSQILDDCEAAKRLEYSSDELILVFGIFSPEILSLLLRSRFYRSAQSHARP